MWQEFKTFVARGNMIDLAIGIVIGAAFSAVVQSLVNDIIMPPIGLLVGRVDFSNLYINLSGQSYPTLAAAQQAGAATINYGLFINSIINFLIIALAIFLIVQQVNKLVRKPEAAEVPAAPTTKTCPYCMSEIAIAATRCPHCTSDLESPAVEAVPIGD